MGRIIQSRAKSGLICIEHDNVIDPPINIIYSNNILQDVPLKKWQNFWGFGYLTHAKCRKCQWDKTAMKREADGMVGRTGRQRDSGPNFYSSSPNYNAVKSRSSDRPGDRMQTSSFESRWHLFRPLPPPSVRKVEMEGRGWSWRVRRNSPRQSVVRFGEL